MRVPTPQFIRKYLFFQNLHVVWIDLPCNQSVVVHVTGFWNIVQTRVQINISQFLVPNECQVVVGREKTKKEELRSVRRHCSGAFLRAYNEGVGHEVLPETGVVRQQDGLGQERQERPGLRLNNNIIVHHFHKTTDWILATTV